MALVAVLVVCVLYTPVAHAQSATPTVSTVAITSDPGNDNTYTTLDVITVGVTFSEAVTITGTPRITLDIGGTERTADYSAAGGETGQILFSYTVEPVDQDDDGVAVKQGSLEFNGGTIQATDDSADATLTHPAMTFADHKVDTEIAIVSNMEQADGTPLRINAGETVRLSFHIYYTTGIYELNQIFLDVKTPSSDLTLEVSTEFHLINNISPEATFIGSVATAGIQRFRSGDFTFRHLQTGRALNTGPIDLYLTARGDTGYVELGTTASTAEDAAGGNRATIGDSVHRSTGGAYTELTTAHIPRFSVVGHLKYTMRIKAADIVSEPYDGAAYAAGERIEVRIVASDPVRTLTDPLTVPLKFGEGSQDIRHASLDTIVGNYHRIALDGARGDGYQFYFSYVVQTGDVDADGVELVADPLGGESDRRIEATLDSRMRMDLSFPARVPGAGQTVEGSQTLGCEEVYCGYVTVSAFSAFPFRETGYDTTIDEATTVGKISRRQFTYAGQEYFIHKNGVYFDDPTLGGDGTYGVSIRLAQLPSEQARQRLAWEASGTTLAFADASIFSFPAPTSEEEGIETDVFLSWTPPDDIIWNPDDRVLVKLVELPVTATFDAASYEKTEGDTFDVTVTLGDSFETKTVTLPVTVTDNGSATEADYSGIPENVVFAPGVTEETFTVTVVDDTEDDDDESITLSFGEENHIRPGGANETATIILTDNDDPGVTVQFGQDSQGVGEGETVNVTISLSADPERTVTIPVTATGQDGAGSTDYSVPASVTFNDGDIEKTIAFMATEDEEDDDDETVKLSFGSSLPARVSEGTRTETTLNIGDDDDPTVTVTFGQTAYTVDEGATQQVTVTVSADPERTIIIPITTTLQGTASADDYSGVLPSVTFTDGTSQTFTFEATQDLIDDDGESVKLGFGTMPDPRVSAPAMNELTVNINDDDTADIVLSPLDLTMEESDSANYTVALATEPTVDVTVTITGHSGTDLTLSGPTLSNNTLTFTPANWNTPQAVTVTAAHDDDGVNDNETLVHTAGGAEYDNVERALEVTVNDDDPLEIVLSPLPMTVEESDSADYGVGLATEPTVAVTVTITGYAGTDLTLSGPTLTFTAANWNILQTVTATAAHDDDIDDDHATLTHTSAGGEYDALTKAVPVTVHDNTGNLRLVDGAKTDPGNNDNPSEGRLEVFYDGEWCTICDDYWTDEEADVSCRQLGFVGGSVEDWDRFRNSFFPPGTSDQAIVLDDVRCTGGQSALAECRHRGWGVHNCKHAEDVGIRCIQNFEGPYITNMEISAPREPTGNTTWARR